MELNFDVEIEPYIIEIIDNIDYYNYIQKLLYRNLSNQRITKSQRNS